MVADPDQSSVPCIFLREQVPERHPGRQHHSGKVDNAGDTVRARLSQRGRDVSSARMRHEAYRLLQTLDEISDMLRVQVETDVLRSRGVGSVSWKINHMTLQTPRLQKTDDVSPGPASLPGAVNEDDRIEHLASEFPAPGRPGERQFTLTGKTSNR